MGNSFFWLTALIGLICGLVGWTLCHFWGWRTPEEQVVRRIVEESEGTEATGGTEADAAKDAEIVRLQALLVAAPTVVDLPVAAIGDSAELDAMQVRVDAAEAAAAGHLSVISALQGELSLLQQPLSNPPVDVEPEQMSQSEWGRRSVEDAEHGSAADERRPMSQVAEAAISGWSTRVAELDALLARQHHEQEQAHAAAAAQAEAAKAAIDELRVELSGLQQRMIDLQSAHDEALSAVNLRLVTADAEGLELRTAVSTVQSNGERAISDWRTRYAALEAEVGRAREWEGRYRALETERDRMRADLEARYRALQSGIAGPTPDDLVVIEGIGPKINAALISDGITRFVDIRDADEQRLRAAIKKAGISFAPSVSTWAEQAGYLVDGDMDGLRRFVDHRSAGRRPTARPATVDVVDGAVIELPAGAEVPPEAHVDTAGQSHEDVR